MDVIISQNDNYNYKISNTNLTNHVSDIMLMETSSPTVQNEKIKISSIFKCKESKTTLLPTINYEKMLYFVCNLCPYLCLQDSKITEHLENEHKDNKTSSKPLQLKCPACPNVFYRNISLKSHLIYDHKVDNSDLRQIIQAVVYYAKKSSYTAVKATVNVPAVCDIPYKNEIDMNLIERLMNSDKIINNEHSYSKEQPEIVNSNVSENTIGHVHVIKDLRLKDIEVVQKIEVKSLRMTSSLPTPNHTDTGRTNTLRVPNDNHTEKKPDVFSKFLDQKKLHKCMVPMCKVYMIALGNLEYHIKCHTDDTFTCPECSETFSSWKPLTAHLWRIHKIDMELFSCDKCNYKSPSLGKLNNSHKLIHSDIRAFECDVCSKKFKNPKQLRNHKEVHKNKTKRDSFTCEICAKAFSDKRQLNVHTDVVHKKIKPFLCSYCGYKGASKSSLKMHIRQHTGEKPFLCDMCDYSTADHNSLRRHKLRHTGQKPYKCLHCSYACIQTRTYMEHIRTKHPGVEKDFVFTCQQCQFRSVNHDMYITHLFLVHQKKS